MKHSSTRMLTMTFLKHRALLLLSANKVTFDCNNVCKPAPLCHFSYPSWNWFSFPEFVEHSKRQIYTYPSQLNATSGIESGCGTRPGYRRWARRREGHRHKMGNCRKRGIVTSLQVVRQTPLCRQEHGRTASGGIREMNLGRRLWTTQIRPQ